MRGLTLATLLAASLATGCDMFTAINDELNWGQDQLDKYAVTEQGQAKRAQGGSDPAPESAGEGESGGDGASATAAAAARRAAKNASEWWDNATSLSPDEKDPTIVSCTLAGTVQFMRESDCLTRGGRPS